MDNSENIFSQIKNLWSSPKVVPLFVMLLALLVVVIASFFYFPIYLSALFVVIFIGLATVTIYSQVSVAKKTETQLPSNKKLQSVLKNTSEAVIIYTPEFKILELNPAAEEVLNINSSQIINEQVGPEMIKQQETRLLTQVIFPSLAPVVNQISTENWPQVVEITTKNPHKKLKTTVDRIKNKGGEVLAFIKIIKDKTREEQILESKTEFITTTAHQLRTPINGMNWAFETINKSIEEGELKEVAEDGLNLSNRALKIINDLLAVTEIEGGGYSLDFENINLVSLINESIKEAKAIAKQYEIEINFNKPQENYQARIDKSRIRSVLSTLLDNAITYNREGGSVTVYLQKTENQMAQISIQDTGIGIPEDEQEKLFEKFHRGDKAKEVQPNGSGLGLYIAKKIVESHGGNIWVESTKGRGSTFYFTVPLA